MYPSWESKPSEPFMTADMSACSPRKDRQIEANTRGASGSAHPSSHLRLRRERFVAGRIGRQRVRTDLVRGIAAGPEVRRGLAVRHRVADRLDAMLQIGHDRPEIVVGLVPE